MAQLEQPQFAFGVKQRIPDTLDAAVAVTLELESYLTPQQMAVFNVEVWNLDHEQGRIGAISGCDKLTTMVERQLDRVERLVLSQKEQGNTRTRESFARELHKEEMMSGYVGDVAEKVTSLGSVVRPGQPMDKGEKNTLMQILCLVSHVVNVGVRVIYKKLP